MTQPDASTTKILGIGKNEYCQATKANLPASHILTATDMFDMGRHGKIEFINEKGYSIG